MEIKRLEETYRHLPGALLFERFPEDTGIMLDDEADAGESGKGRKLFCVVCSSPITDQNELFYFHGQGIHCRTNPAGISYTFSCFWNAPGCAVQGPLTSEHTWFAGYAWQIGSCRKCGEHMGWVFRGPDRFFGIITDKLVSRED